MNNKKYCITFFALLETETPM